MNKQRGPRSICKKSPDIERGDNQEKGRRPTSTPLTQNPTFPAEDYSGGDEAKGPKRRIRGALLDRFAAIPITILRFRKSLNVLNWVSRERELRLEHLLCCRLRFRDELFKHTSPNLGPRGILISNSQLQSNEEREEACLKFVSAVEVVLDVPST
jgi:hypothetical protein